MSVLTERLRNVTYMDDAEYLCAQAADALEAAEAKLAAIDALHRGEYDTDPDSFTIGGVFCITDDEEWPCETHRILHPEEEQ